MHKKVLLLTSLATALFAFAQPAAAQTDNKPMPRVNPVITSVPSLAITPDARGAAMGHLGVATTADAYAQYWNPAKYPYQAERSGVYFAYVPWLSKITRGVALMNIGGYYRFDTPREQSISASLRYFSTGKITQWDDMLQQVGELSSGELAIDVAYATKLTPTFSVAAAARYIHADPGIKREGVCSGNAFAIDLALYGYKPFLLAGYDTHWTYGVNIKNLGTKIRFGEASRSSFIPTNLGIGTGLDVTFSPLHKVEGAIEINKLLVPTPPSFDMAPSPERDEAFRKYYATSLIAGVFKSFGDAPGGFAEELKEMRYAVGATYSYRQMLFARLGYSYIHPDKGAMQLFTFGGGFRYQAISLDAAYQIATMPNNALDGTFSLSMAIALDQIENLWR